MPSTKRTVMRPPGPGRGSPPTPQPLDANVSAAFVEACRLARLRRRPDRLGQEAVRLQRGDLYAWREGLPSSPGVVRLALIAEPRSVFIVDDRVWWVPRLDQLLARLEAVVRRREPQRPAQQVREWLALRLAEQMRERERSWEEAALELLVALA